MPSTINPSLVLARMAADAQRLRTWAVRTAPMEYRQMANDLVKLLADISPKFDNEEILRSAAAQFPDVKVPPRSEWSNTKLKLEHVVDKLSPTEKAEIQQAARDAFDIGDYTNPYTDSHLRSRAWSQAQNDYNASLQENQGDAEPELP